MRIVALDPGNFQEWPNVATQQPYTYKIAELPIMGSKDTIVVNGSISPTSIFDTNIKSGTNDSSSFHTLQVSTTKMRSTTSPKGNIDHNSTFVNELFFVFICLGVFIYSWVRHSSGEFTKRIFSSFFNGQMIRKIFEEQRPQLNFYGRFLDFIFILNISLLITRYYLKFFGDLSGGRLVLSFLAVFGVVWFLILLRTFSYKILGFILLSNSLVREYLHMSTIYFRLNGIIFLPLVLFAVFMRDPFDRLFLGFSVLTLIIIYGLILYRGATTVLRSRVSPLYVFFFLVTMEILPLALLFKYLSNNVAY